jgi:hypothetical protein
MYTNQRTQTLDSSLTIRLATSADSAGLRRLAERDSAAVPSGRLLVAATDGEIRAAVSLAGDAIADPFHPTEETVALLRERQRQLRGEGRGLRARLGALRHRRPRRAMAPQPAGTLRPH